jgi:hypothetical protein
LADSTVRAGASAWPAASGLIVCVVDFVRFFAGQDAETLGSAVASGLSRASVLALEGRPLLAPFARLWLAVLPAVPLDPVAGLLLEPLPGFDVDGSVDDVVGVGVGVGVVVGVGV